MRRGSLFILLVFIGMVYGCAGQGSTPVPPATVVPAGPTHEFKPPVPGEPGPAATATVAPSGPSQPGGPQAGVPAAPNLSLVQAKIIAIAQTANGPLLTVEILHSQPQPGFADFGSALVGKQIQATLLDRPDVSLFAGLVIQGELSYNGDESGGLYLLRHIIAQP